MTRVLESIGRLSMAALSIAVTIIMSPVSWIVFSATHTTCDHLGRNASRVASVARRARRKSGRLRASAGRHARRLEQKTKTAGQQVRRELNKRRYTVSARVDQYGDGAKERLLPAYEAAGVEYPPHDIVLVGLKDKAELHLYARNDDDEDYTWVHAWDWTTNSGGPGPKLREGDRQVPEGLYRIEAFNPNSANHLALRVNYPNADDRRRARKAGRKNLGGDIMIHGGASSIGCVAIGDPAIEELFVNVADIGRSNVRLILTPTDMRTRRARVPRRAPKWTKERYADIATELSKLPPIPRRWHKVAKR